MHTTNEFTRGRLLKHLEGHHFESLSLDAMKREAVLWSIRDGQISNDDIDEDMVRICSTSDIMTCLRLAQKTLHSIIEEASETAHKTHNTKHTMNNDDQEIADMIAALTKKIAGSKAESAPIDENAIRTLIDSELIPLRGEMDSFRDFQKSLESDPIKAKRAKIVTVAKSTSDPVMAVLLPYYVPNEENVNRTLLLSPPSFGKSFSIQKIGELYDVYLQHGCSDDADENATILGGVIPDGEGSFLVNDGVLSQAVRAAGEGKTVLLCLDEVLRLSESTMSFLLTFLQPVGDEYQLTTRKNDGGKLERISCKTNKLHIVAAANLGPIQPLEAFWSRFNAKRLAFNVSFAQNVGSSILAANGVEDEGGVIASKFAHAMKISRDLKNNGRLAFSLDFRKLVDACRIDPDYPLKWVESIVEDHCAQWDSMSGDIIEDSVNACEIVISALK